MRAGSEGGLAIAEAIRVNRTMTALDLQRNNLGETAVLAVAFARLSNPVLETVNLEWNVDTDEGGAVASHVDVVPHEVGCLVHPYAAIVLPHVCDDVSHAHFTRVYHPRSMPTPTRALGAPSWCTLSTCAASRFGQGLVCHARRAREVLITFMNSSQLHVCYHSFASLSLLCFR
jgi:hypothetical protein